MSAALGALVLGAGLGLGGPALAQTRIEVDRPKAVAPGASAEPHRNAYLRTIEMLDNDGYRITLVERTFLNRIMVRAEKGHTRREIVISQATGMVLRDVVFGE